MRGRVIWWKHMRGRVICDLRGRVICGRVILVSDGKDEVASLGLE